MNYPSFGDSIDDTAHFIIGVNKLATRVHYPVVVLPPPLSTSWGLAQFIHLPFNRCEFLLSPLRHDAAFTDFAVTSHTSIPTVAIGNSTQSKRIYNLVRHHDYAAMSAGSGVYSLDGLCPPLESPNQNAFWSSFGIEFSLNGAGFIRQISTFEHMRCFQLSDDITHALLYPANYSLCNSGIPAWTSY